jgi:two-component system chemotaxis response regulator CheY
MRILVVDDEFVALTKITSILAPFGDCDAATNGTQALDLFVQACQEGYPYSLVTIDIDMPGINGLELIHRLNAEEQERRIIPAKKVMVTADSSLTAVSRAAGHRCDGFIVKPVKRAVIIGKLREIGLIHTGSDTSAGDRRPSCT